MGKPEVTIGFAGLTSELTDSLSDYTVNALTETGTHQGCFNTGTEELTFENQQQSNNADTF